VPLMFYLILTMNGSLIHLIYISLLGTLYSHLTGHMRPIYGTKT